MALTEVSERKWAARQAYDPTVWPVSDGLTMRASRTGGSKKGRVEEQRKIGLGDTHPELNMTSSRRFCHTRCLTPIPVRVRNSLAARAMPILSHITFGDGLTNHLNELRAECEQLCKKQDSDLAQYVDYNEAANQAAMHLDMGVPKEKAIAASVEAVLYTAKQAGSVAKAREFEQAELKANAKNMHQM